MSYAGVSYQFINNTNGNSIIIRTISNNNISKFSSLVPTKGFGSSINHLFKQNFITKYNNTLFMINAGSGTISMFNINPYDPVDISFVTTAPILGNYPINIIANEKYVAVLTVEINSVINLYTWDKSSIKPYSDWNRIIPNNLASNISFSSDNNSIIVSYKASDLDSGGIYIYSINNDILAKEPINIILNGSIISFSMTPIGNDNILITDAVMGYSIINKENDVSLFEVPSDLGDTICRSIYSQQTGNYYLIGSSSSTVVEINIDLSFKSTIVNTYLLKASTITDVDIFTINGFDYLYINSPLNKSIIIMKLNISGKAEVIQIDSSLPNNVNPQEISGMVTINTTSESNMTTIWVWVILLIIFIIFIIALFTSY